MKVPKLKSSTHDLYLAQAVCLKFSNAAEWKIFTGGGRKSVIPDASQFISAFNFRACQTNIKHEDFYLLEHPIFNH